LSIFPNNPINPVAGERRALRVGKISDVASIVKLAPSTIRAKMRVGEFPASIRLSYKLAVWNLDQVEEWFLEKLKAAPVYVPHVRVAAEVANG
jgi:predicted DNA-binding transcriptional regulator AlpA